MTEVIAVFSACAQARADADADARAGEALAANVCAPCHALPAQAGGNQKSALPGRSFLEIANSDKAAPGALWEFLHTANNSVSHPGNMPSPMLNEDQIRLISAYIATLRASK
jgi:mono/diheme cytochrome c family protein